MAILDVLKEVVLTCGKLVLSLRGNDEKGVIEKDDNIGQHFSTIADRESLRSGLSIFSREMPEEVIVAEEQENPRQIPLDCTVFDPLDGTTNFFNGLDEFGVTTCTLRNGAPICSATYFPVRKTLVFAARGKGGWVVDSGGQVKSLKICWHGVMDKAQIGTDVGSWTTKQGVFDTVLRPLSCRFNMLSSMAAVEGGRRVLFGNTGAYYNLGSGKIWDAAAMALVIQEAGGIVCDPRGNPLRWGDINCDWVFAVNQEFADVVLKYSCQWPGRRR